MFENIFSTLYNILLYNFNDTENSKSSRRNIHTEMFYTLCILLTFSKRLLTTNRSIDT